MSPPLLLVHGWGFGPEIWAPLCDRLPDFDIAAVDMGFRGRPHHPAPPRPLVVAHSMGLAWALANVPRPWAGLLAINAFARFTRAPSFVEGVPPQMVERMRSRFKDHPAEVADTFLRRCGVEAPDTEGLEPDTLGAALDWLATCDERPALAALDAPVQALAGTFDPIVPEPMSRAAFAGLPLVLAQGAGHLLPLSHPDWVAAYVRLLASRTR
jgi:pimeloyl-[acyl-carrier protein] methyl ester esterase